MHHFRVDLNILSCLNTELSNPALSNINLLPKKTHFGVIFSAMRAPVVCGGSSVSSRLRGGSQGCTARDGWMDTLENLELPCPGGQRSGNVSQESSPGMFRMFSPWKMQPWDVQDV